MHRVLLAASLLATLTGHWSGTVTTPAGALPIELSITEAGATLDAAPLGYVDKPVKVIRRDEQGLQIEMPVDGQSVTAGLAFTNDDLRGTARLGEAAFPIALRRATPVAKNYTTQDVSIRSGDVTLAATLTLPRSTTPVPAIVFVAGLAPRGDAARFLADAFATRGFAVLTYDRRGIGKSTGDRHTTFSAVADDAAAAVRYLATRKEVDAKRIGIRGQSQGAWIAPLAATRVPVAFAILTGGGAVQPWESETYAIPARMRADGFSETEIAEASRYLAAMFAVGRTGKGWEELSATIAALRARGAKWLGTYGAVPPSLQYLRELWEGEFAYDPAPALRKLTVPVLALEGENDVYSPPAESLRVLEATLGSRDKTLRMIPHATHDFHVAGAPLPLVSQDYLSTMLNWSAAHAGIVASDPDVTDHRVTSPSQNVVLDVDRSLTYIGRIGIDIRDAAHAERVIFATADANGNVQRLWIAQFEKMLPQHRGAYDAHDDHQVTIGDLTFNQAQGRYSFPAAVAAKPGLEADQTRAFLAQHNIRIDADLAIARFETLTDATRRAELIVFYWEPLEGNTDFAAFAEKAKKMF
ncbi:MAG TPA: alpha/beta fold hydrolase, partial [Thermoanaerobaculia bacterium]|nr:alpha/beta fold hydrolase [Thermoanaerobaculia bacterium]